MRKVLEIEWGHVRDHRKTAIQNGLDLENQRLEAAIDESRWILRLKAGFDGRGSPSYTTTVWDRAARFVKLQWTEYMLQYGEAMPVPSIQPGPDGTIDVFWETLGFELLVNIPVDPKKVAEFSGDNRGKGKIEGTLDPTLPNRGLVSWLSPR